MAWRRRKLSSCEEAPNKKWCFFFFFFFFLYFSIFCFIFFSIFHMFSQYFGVFSQYFGVFLSISEFFLSISEFLLTYLLTPNFLIIIPFLLIIPEGARARVRTRTRLWGQWRIKVSDGSQTHILGTGNSKSMKLRPWAIISLPQIEALSRWLWIWQFCIYPSMLESLYCRLQVHDSFCQAPFVSDPA